jgi:ribulose-5-phosphate 4-epimerase/fuculose-1-phosphate aldolase
VIGWRAAEGRRPSVITVAEENHVVMHTHARAGMAIAAIKEGLLPISMFATAFHNRIGYHDYEGASLYPDERERIVKSLGPYKAMILRNRQPSRHATFIAD